MNEPKFVYVTYIATTPEKLWQALTDGAFTERYWFGTRIASDWNPGARVTFTRGDLVSDYGVVLECDPPRRLSYTWRVEFSEEFRNERPSRVTFEIEPMPGRAGGTTHEVKLTVTHDDFDAGSKVFRAISGGWPLVLASLKSFLETGGGLGSAGVEALDAAKARALAAARGEAA
jgi:uncharacterized protein YndB with AHSA1/START domain